MDSKDVRDDGSQHALMDIPFEVLESIFFTDPYRLAVRTSSSIHIEGFNLESNGLVVHVAERFDHPCGINVFRIDSPNCNRSVSIRIDKSILTPVVEKRYVNNQGVFVVFYGFIASVIGCDDNLISFLFFHPKRFLKSGLKGLPGQIFLGDMRREISHGRDMFHLEGGCVKVP